MTDHRLLTETEHADLVAEVQRLQINDHNGDYLLNSQRLLIRTAQHIDALVARNEVIAKGIRVIDLDHQGQAKALEDIASAYLSRDYAEIHNVLKRRGFIE